MNLQQQIAAGKDISKKILSALLSAGADKKKAKIAAEAISLKTVQSLARESETYSDLSDPDKEATKKDLRILELNIQKEMATMQSNLQKEMATMQSNLQKEMATMQNNLRKEMATMQNNLQKEMATMQNNLRKEMATIKTDTIKWVFAITAGSLTITLSSMFAMFQLLL